LHVTPATITNDTATVTDAATVYISSAPSATGAKNASLLVASGRTELRGQFATNVGGNVSTFGGTDTTPSVATGNLWKTHASVQTITNFTDGIIGQTITVLSTAAVTFNVTSTSLKGGSTDIVTAIGDITVWTLAETTNWYLNSFMDQSTNVASGGGGSGAVSSVTNGADNRISTFSGSDTLNGEANLTFDGSLLTVTGALKITPSVASSSAASTTITVDFSSIGDHIYTLSTGVTAVTIDASNMTSSIGRQGTIIIKTPSSGTWTTSWTTGGHWHFESGTPPSLSSDYEVYDVFSYYIVDTDKVLISSSSSFDAWTG
jgi:hypothetical protein